MIRRRDRRRPGGTAATEGGGGEGALASPRTMRLRRRRRRSPLLALAWMCAALPARLCRGSGDAAPELELPPSKSARLDGGVGFLREDLKGEDADEFDAPNDHYEAFLDEDTGLFTTVSVDPDDDDGRDHRRHHVRRTQLVSSDCFGVPERFSQTAYLILYDMHRVIDSPEEINALKRIFQDVMNVCRARENCLEVEKVDLHAQELQEHVDSKKAPARRRNRENEWGRRDRKLRRQRVRMGDEKRKRKKKGRWMAVVDEDGARLAANRTRTDPIGGGGAADLFDGDKETEQWIREEERRLKGRGLQLEQTVIATRGTNDPPRLMAKLTAEGPCFGAVCDLEFPLTQTAGQMFGRRLAAEAEAEAGRELQGGKGSCASRMLNRLVNSRYEAFQCLTLVEIYGSDPRCF